MAAPFVSEVEVRFRHCDPAGIVFYPRYFEMINDFVEEWFDKGMGLPFHALHVERHIGTPMASVQCDFTAPSRHGDQIVLDITIQKLGRSSMILKTVALAGAETRFVADHVLVCIDDQGRPRPWPAPVRKTVNDILEVVA